MDNLQLKKDHIVQFNTNGEEQYPDSEKDEKWIMSQLEQGKPGFKRLIKDL